MARALAGCGITFGSLLTLTFTRATCEAGVASQQAGEGQIHGQHFGKKDAKNTNLVETFVLLAADSHPALGTRDGCARLQEYETKL